MVSDSSRAYYTANDPQRPGMAEESGWGWAESAASSRTDHGVRGRPVVHDVRVYGNDIDTDKNLNPSGQHGAQMTANKLRITDTHWTPKPDPFYQPNGIQGTFPHVNWNQFKPNGAEHNYFDVGSANSGAEEGRAEKASQERGAKLQSDMNKWNGLTLRGYSTRQERLF